MPGASAKSPTASRPTVRSAGRETTPFSPCNGIVGRGEIAFRFSPRIPPADSVYQGGWVSDSPSANRPGRRISAVRCGGQIQGVSAQRCGRAIDAGRVESSDSARPFFDQLPLRKIPVAIFACAVKCDLSQTHSAVPIVIAAPASLLPARAFPPELDSESPSLAPCRGLRQSGARLLLHSHTSPDGVERRGAGAMCREN